MRNAITALIAVLTLCGCGAATNGAPPSATKAPAEPPSIADTKDESFEARMDKAALEGLCLQSAESHVENVRKALDEIDTALPNVPPEEADYLQRESKALDNLYLKQAPDSAPSGPVAARWNVLYSRRLYYVWVGRKYLADGIASVDWIYNPKACLDSKPVRPCPSNLFRRDLPDTLYRMLWAANDVEIATRRLREFLSSQELRPNPLLTIEQYREVSDRVAFVSMELNRAMRCQLGHVVLDKPQAVSGQPGK